MSVHSYDCLLESQCKLKLRFSTNISTNHSTLPKRVCYLQHSDLPNKSRQNHVKKRQPKQQSPQPKPQNVTSRRVVSLTSENYMSLHVKKKSTQIRASKFRRTITIVTTKRTTWKKKQKQVKFRRTITSVITKRIRSFYPSGQLMKTAPKKKMMLPLSFQNMIMISIFMCAIFQT